MIYTTEAEILAASLGFYESWRRNGSPEGIAAQDAAAFYAYQMSLLRQEVTWETRD